MSHRDRPLVGYVLKRYPRYSETFIVNEILAHQEARQPIEIFSLRPPTDTFFVEQVARVRAVATYIPSGNVTASALWDALDSAQQLFGDLKDVWKMARNENLLMQDVFQAIYLACEIRRKKIDHLHAHFATAAADTARVAARIAGITYSLTAHAKDIFHESVDRDQLERKLDDAAAVVTVSDFNNDYLKVTFGDAARRVTRIYNGLDLAEFPYQTPANRPARIVAVGRLVEKKGFTDLVEACSVLLAKGRDFTCQIIGGGELDSQLAAQVQRVGLAGTVELLGPRPPAEVALAIQSAVVVAVPCVVGADGNRDGLPTVLLEAMALGTPCVSTDVTGIPEILHDGKSGLSVPQRDPVALAAAIERLLDDADLRCRLTRRARRLVEQDFDIHKNTERLRTLFRTASSTVRRSRTELQEVG